MECDVFLSEVVIEELKATSLPLRDKMLEVAASFAILPSSELARALAMKYIEQRVFPEKYFDDALHVAIASANRIGILLSWNFSHLVKLKTRRLVALINAIENQTPVEIISPPEL